MKKLLLLVLATLVLPSSLYAATFQASDNINFNDKLEDDLYLFGEEIVIDHDINGDLFVLANKLTVNGNIYGDVFSSAADITLNGKIADDARIAAGRITVNNSIGGDLIASGGTVIISEKVLIAGDVVLASGLSEMKGAVGKNLKAFSLNFTLSGSVGGNAEIVADKNFTIDNDAFIAGNLSYYALQKIDFRRGVVRGQIQYNDLVGEVSVFDQFTSQFAPERLLFKFWGLLAVLLVALLLVIISPTHLLKSAKEIENNFWKNVLVGFLGALALFASSIILFVTVIGIPLGLILLVLTCVFLYVSRIFLGLWLGQKIIQKKRKKITKPYVFALIALGLLVYYLVGMIPFYIGFIADLILMFAGFGALLLSRRTYFRFMQKNKMV